MPSKTYKVPSIKIVSEEGGASRAIPDTNTILDYMGVPAKIIKQGETGNIEVNALPVRAYVKIWNEFFRDQNVGNPAVFSTDDNDVEYAAGGAIESLVHESNILQNAHNGGYCLPVNKFHDYFTSCLPYPQRGPEVTIALTGNAPVKMYDHAGINGPTSPTII